MANSNVNNAALEKLSNDRIPDIVLVKKVYADKALRNRRRKWKLRHMQGVDDADAASDNRLDSSVYIFYGARHMQHMNPHYIFLCS